MPLATITDWSNGPMGSCFFMMFRRNVTFFYDGGDFHSLLGSGDDGKKKEYESDTLVALSLLMLDP